MDISSALRVLRDTPREILRRHARDATTTLREMERRLKDLLQDKEPDSEDLPACHLCKQALSSTTREEFDTMASTAPFRPTESFGQMGTRSGCGNDAGNSKTSQPRTRFPSMADTAQDRPAALLKALLEVIPSAWELIAKEPVKVIHKKRALQQDRRVDDILRVDGNKAPSNEDKLFRGLAQRSFAIQYSQYQRENQKYLRVDELFDDISSHKQGQQNALHKRRKGCISSWVRQHFTSAEGQNNTIIRCVHAGIKQLVLEKFLQQRLEPRPANACGISALMALTVHNFKILHLEEIPSFLDLVFAGSSKVSLPVGMLNVTVQETNTASRHVLDIFEEVSPWFEKFQREYDGECLASNDEIQPQLPPQKRVRVANTVPERISIDRVKETVQTRGKLLGDEQTTTEHQASLEVNKSGLAQFGVDSTRGVGDEAYQELSPEAPDIDGLPQTRSNQEQGGSDVPNNSGASSSMPEQPAPAHDIPTIFDLPELVSDPSLDNFPGDAADPFLHADFPEEVGDPFLHADFPEEVGDPFLHADFPDEVGDPLLHADFLGDAGDPFLHADFPGDVGDPFPHADFPGDAGDPFSMPTSLVTRGIPFSTLTYPISSVAPQVAAAQRQTVQT